MRFISTIKKNLKENYPFLFNLLKKIWYQVKSKSVDSSALFPLEPPLPLPNNVSEKQLLEFLKSVLVENASLQEIINYCCDSFRRFVYTYGMVRDLSGKCLELGANPYFTTILLKQFTLLDLTLANYFGEQCTNSLVTQRVNFNDFNTGRQVKVDFNTHHFNIENAPFPFPDDTFDILLFCEIVEHLLCDPVKVLREIKRVLKKGGRLILTTPNVSRLDNVTRMIAGENIYDPYSGYGPYGRHNREYNKHELYLLLTYLGFSIESMFTADVHPNRANDFFPISKVERHLTKRRDDLGQYIFVRAVNYDSGKKKKPSFLYRSYPEGELETV